MPKYVSRADMDTNNNAAAKKLRLDAEMQTMPVLVAEAGSNVYMEDPPPTKPMQVECICNRKTTGIFCMNCKLFTPNIRRRQPCPRHPTTLWLMDIEACPNCQTGTNIFELASAS